MQRRPAQSRWVDCIWEPHGVIADPGGEARLLREDGALAQWLHPGFSSCCTRTKPRAITLTCRRRTRKVFVLWRMEDDQGAAARRDGQLGRRRALAGRRAFGGRRRDAADIFAWVGDYVEKNYRPQPKKRIKPRSFQHPKDRL